VVLVARRRHGLPWVAAAIDVLADVGPTLGRPLVDRIKGSTVHNLKELSGSWKTWYPTAIADAETRYGDYLHDIEGEGQ
jgi:hypothetical protein